MSDPFDKYLEKYGMAGDPFERYESFAAGEQRPFARVGDAVRETGRGALNAVTRLGANALTLQGDALRALGIESPEYDAYVQDVRGVQQGMEDAPRESGWNAPFVAGDLAMQAAQYAMPPAGGAFTRGAQVGYFQSDPEASQGQKALNAGVTGVASKASDVLLNRLMRGNFMQLRPEARRTADMIEQATGRRSYEPMLAEAWQPRGVVGEMAHRIAQTNPRVASVARAQSNAAQRGLRTAVNRKAGARGVGDDTRAAVDQLAARQRAVFRQVDDMEFSVPPSVRDDFAQSIRTLEPNWTPGERVSGATLGTIRRDLTNTITDGPPLRQTVARRQREALDRIMTRQMDDSLRRRYQYQLAPDGGEARLATLENLSRQGAGGRPTERQTATALSQRTAGAGSEDVLRMRRIAEAPLDDAGANYLSMVERKPNPFLFPAGLGTAAGLGGLAGGTTGAALATGAYATAPLTLATRRGTRFLTKPRSAATNRVLDFVELLRRGSLGEVPNMMGD